MYLVNITKITYLINKTLLIDNKKPINLTIIFYIQNKINYNKINNKKNYIEQNKSTIYGKQESERFTSRLGKQTN